VDTNKQIAVTSERVQVSSYRAFADEDTASAIAGEMVLFNKGLWTRGEAKRAIPADAIFVANLDEGYRGMVRWFSGKPVEYQIGRIADGFKMPLRDELGYDDQSKWDTDANGEPRDPWQPTYRLVMKDVAGELVTFVGSSWGARRGLQQLYGRFDQERKGPGLWPVVKPETEHRQNKRYGVIPEPRFNIVGWCAWDGKLKLKAIAKGKPEITDDDPRTMVGQSIAGQIDDSIPFAPEWRA
jgi:hypothetical protein